jgi:hypothetical protein
MDQKNYHHPDSELAALRNEVADLKDCVGKLNTRVGDLVDAWNAGKSFLAVIKWGAGLASAVAIIWASFHGSK